ncbi:Uncharacterised protein [Mycobacteroides abscessus subsp. abscessus]|nr:Uncharacterised protein [Mycobacteroides abscessus subsp. abscessus]
MLTGNDWGTDELIEVIDPKYTGLPLASRGACTDRILTRASLVALNVDDSPRRITTKSTISMPDSLETAISSEPPLYTVTRRLASTE